MAIDHCTCSHEAQDRLHGKGMRVFNPMAVHTGDGRFRNHRCTVCKREKLIRVRPDPIELTPTTPEPEETDSL